jgi:hypothetical protein
VDFHTGKFPTYLQPHISATPSKNESNSTATISQHQIGFSIRAQQHRIHNSFLLTDIYPTDHPQINSKFSEAYIRPLDTGALDIQTSQLQLSPPFPVRSDLNGCTTP